MLLEDHEVVRQGLRALLASQPDFEVVTNESTHSGPSPLARRPRSADDEPMPFDHGLTRLTRDECMALLANASFARVGVSVEALPAILPVTIAVMNQSVIFRTIPGTKLARASAGSILAIEADHYDTSERRGWSVLVRGVGSELLDKHDITRARELLTDSWIDRQTAEQYVNVSCDLVTGRRLDHPTHAADGAGPGQILDQSPVRWTLRP